MLVFILYFLTERRCSKSELIYTDSVVCVWHPYRVSMLSFIFIIRGVGSVKDFYLYPKWCYIVSVWFCVICRWVAPCGHQTRSPSALQDQERCRCVVVLFVLNFYLLCVICVVSLTTSVTGTNRFEVTLEKSNKNFSKKIQQVCLGNCFLLNGFKLDLCQKCQIN